MMNRLSWKDCQNFCHGNSIIAGSQQLPVTAKKAWKSYAGKDRTSFFQISAETIQYDGAGRSVKGDDRVPEKKEITGEEPAQEGSLAAGSFVVKNALQYIEEHYNEKITLTHVAEKTYVSQWHLSKLLNKEEGKNFSEILNCIRIRHAKEFMKEPAYRLADIAELVGFTDVTHFSRVFKKNEGISANEYRNTKL